MSYIQYQNAKLTVAALADQLTSEPNLAMLQRKEHPRRLSVFDELLEHCSDETSRPAGKKPNKFDKRPRKGGDSETDKKATKKKGSSEDQHEDGDSDSGPDDEDDDAPSSSATHPPKIRALAILSLSAVFSDILPSYRIRQYTAQELGDNNLSKEVKALRSQEGRLLAAYQRYLKVVETTMQPAAAMQHSPSGTAEPVLLRACITAFANLLKTANHFNFRSNIIKALLGVISRRNPLPLDFTSIVYSALIYVFRNDRSGEVTLELVKGIGSLFKSATSPAMTFPVAGRISRFLTPELVNTLAFVPLRVHVDEAKAASLHDRAMKKKRKKDEDAANVDDDMKESSAQGDKGELARVQAETLEIIIVSYFRVLKCVTAAEDERERLEKASGVRKAGSNSPGAIIKTGAEALLPAVLAGLSTHLHLVNIDTVVDLLKLLKSLVSERHAEVLPLSVTLSSILTSLRTLQGVGMELKVDEKSFVDALYRCIPKLGEVGSHWSDEAAEEEVDVEGSDERSQQQRDVTLLALSCIEVAFLKRRELQREVPPAFVKALLSSSLAASAVDPPTSAALALAARALSHRYLPCAQLLESEEDAVTSGAYEPNCPEPASCNIFAARLWEVTCLRFAPNAELAKMGGVDCGNGTRLVLPKEDAVTVYKQLKRKKDEFIHSFKEPKAVHPLRRVKGKQRGKGEEKFLKISERDVGNNFEAFC